MTKKSTAPAPALKRKPVAAAAAEIPGGALPPAVGGDLLEPASGADLAEKVAAIAAKTGAPILTPAHIQATIVDEIYTRIEGTFTTVCTLKLRNGATVCGINYGTVSPENYDQQIACEMAYKGAVAEIWPLEGYLLREFLADAKNKSELNPVNEIAKACHNVLNAYFGSQGGPVSAPWKDLGDEDRTAVLDRVTAVLRGDSDALDNSVEDVLLGALVHTLADGRHG